MKLFRTHKPKNAADIFEAYKQLLQANAKDIELALTQTALVRFTIPGWSGVYLAGGKATAAEVQASLAHLQQVSLKQFQSALTVQEQVFDHLQIDKNKRRQPRCYLKKLIDWTTEQEAFTALSRGGSQDEQTGRRRLISAKGQARSDTYGKNVRLSGRKQTPPFALGTRKGDYFNSDLVVELKAFEYFMRASLRQKGPTAQGYIGEAKRILGWLYRHKKISVDTGQIALETETSTTLLRELSLDDLRLSLIVPTVRLKLNSMDFSDKEGISPQMQYGVAKVLAQEEAEKVGKRTLSLAKEYLNWRAVDPKTNNLVSIVFTTIAKFQYKDETNSLISQNYDDILPVRILRNFTNELRNLAQNAPPVVAHELKSVTWPEALQVLLELQKDADTTHRFTKKHGRRTDGSIARSIQNLLIHLLLIAFPPERSRTIYELKLDRTLKCGIRARGTFIPIERVKDPTLAKWYIHHRSTDYKTGGTYGEVWDEIPDTPIGLLDGGKTFYYYLDLWLNKYRAILKPQHDFVFTNTKGKPMDLSGVKSRVREAFLKYTKVPVTPKELRKMYVSFLKDSGATEAELEAAAARMKHSRMMQSRIYDQQTRESKTAPIHLFNERMLKALGNSKALLTTGANEEEK